MANTLVGRKRIRKFRRLRRGYYAFLLITVAYGVSFFLPLIANNVAIDHLRRRQLDTVSVSGSPHAVSESDVEATSFEIASQAESALDEIEARELGTAIERAIGQLRPEYRSCILLRHVEGRSYEEIAATLDLPLGTVKTYIVDRDGRETVLGFHLPGEVIGLDAISGDRYPCNAVALEPVALCRFSFPEIATLATRIPGIQQRLFQLLWRQFGDHFAVAAFEDGGVEAIETTYKVGMSNHGFPNPVVMFLGDKIRIEAGQFENGHAHRRKAAAIFGHNLWLPGLT